MSTTAPDLSAPVNLGPVNLGPVNLGPVNLGPVNLGPVNLGPVNLGPVNLGPVNLGPVNLGPVNLDLYGRIPDGLTRRARSFAQVHGIQAEAADAEQHRSFWTGLGIPTVEIDRAVAFQRRWGGLILPPGPAYEGGPRCFAVDTPDGSPSTAADGSVVHGWWFDAGPQRTSVPYSFMIGPAGEFGLHAERWAPLHASVEGWIESLALAYHAAMWAKQITTVTGAAADDLDLTGFEPVPEVRGLSDTWWRGTDSLVAIYAGDTACMGAPAVRTARIYSGLDRWGLHGGVEPPGTVSPRAGRPGSR